MSYQTAFPDFDPATMPDIPESWRDVSWHNDACQCFEAFSGDGCFTRCIVWIEHENPERRETMAPRFTVAFDNERGDCETVQQATHWRDVLRYVETRRILGAAYIQKVGHNPFLDDPKQTPQEVFERLAYHAACSLFDCNEIAALESTGIV